MVHFYHKNQLTSKLHYGILQYAMTQKITKRIQRSDIPEKYGIKYLALFGSFVTNKFKKDSDIDILVEFVQPIGFLKFVRLENELSRLFNQKVDLVTKNSLSKFFRDDVLKKMQIIYAHQG